MKLPTKEEIAQMSEEERAQLRCDLVKHMSNLLDEMSHLRKDIQADLQGLGESLKRWKF